jgi:WD40 repeat protein
VEAQTDNPYVGWRAFRSSEQRYFFGRDAEIAILEGLVLARAAVLLYAPSGAGKSSLIHAGLTPSLTRTRTVGKGIRARTYQKMRVLPVAGVGGAVPSGINPDAIANLFSFSVLTTLQPDIDPQQFAQTALPAGLAPLLEHPDGATRTGLDTLLILDQFEEFFTRETARWRDREAFFQQLRTALQQLPGLRVLISMREDYIAEITPYQGLLPEQLAARFRLERLRPSAALEAVQKPAEQAGRSFPEPAARRLIRNLCRSQVVASAPSPDPTQPLNAEEEASCLVEPMHLQVVCHQLWSRLTSQQTIDDEAVRRFGDVHEALTTVYHEAVADAATQIGGREMHVRYWFEKELITPAYTRGLVYQDVRSATTGSLPNSAVQILDQAHLIRPVIRGTDTWYELAHDRLIEPILQANQAWWLIQTRLTRTAKTWDDAGRGNLPPIDADLEKQIRQADERTLDPPVRDFVQTALVEIGDTAQQDRLLERDLAEKGWGVIFAADADPALSAVLHELLALRRSQAQERFQIFAGDDGYQTGERASQFLERHESGAMPYYLLIVGPPSAIPFEFQYYLSINHAVGRIAFAHWHEYVNYARSVVAAATGQVALPPGTLVFATRHLNDPATTYSYKNLALPLMQELSVADPNWPINLMTEDELPNQSKSGSLQPMRSAMKADLHYALSQDPTWSLLFVAAHGIQFPANDPRQRDTAGALLCQDSPSAESTFPEHYFAASDLDALPQTSLLGTIAFLFGEFTAGTPHLDNFAFRHTLNAQTILAPEDFLARLPQRMLAHPNGGALAVIGHVDQNWTTSFIGRSRRGQSSIGAFAFLFTHLMRGYPVGFAMEEFRRRFRRELSDWVELQMQQATEPADNKRDQAAVIQETAMIDLRNYIILGDPAVYISVGDPNAGPHTRRTFLEPVTGPLKVKLHPASVTAATWRPDGQSMLTVCADGAVRIWPTPTGEPVRIDADPGDAIQVATWRADGTRVATLSRRGDLKSWAVGDSSEDQPTSVMITTSADLFAWQPSGTTLAVVSGADLQLYDSRSGALLHTLSGHTDIIRACAWSPDGTRIATSSRDATLRIWDVSSGKPLTQSLPRSTGEKAGLVAWSPNRHQMAYAVATQPDPAAPGSSVIRILDTASYTLLHELIGHQQPVRALAWRADGSLMTSISDDISIVWDMATAQQRHALRRSEMPISDAAYSPDGKWLWTYGDDQQVRIWKAEDGALLQTIANQSAAVSSVAWHPASTTIVIARRDGLALIVNIEQTALTATA